jgi:glutamyl-tRNA synthetase
VLDEALVRLDALPVDGWSTAAVEAALRGLEEPLGMKLRKFIPVLYVAVMGRPTGIPLFDSIGILGRERTLARLRAARARLG